MGALVSFIVDGSHAAVRAALERALTTDALRSEHVEKLETALRASEAELRAFLGAEPALPPR